MATITGTNNPDIITPGSVSFGVVGGAPTLGSDYISGGGGADSIDGSGGRDTIFGDGGDDTIQGRKRQ
jgi:Ca2+-binding RTX toxin-like protein